MISFDIRILPHHLFEYRRYHMFRRWVVWIIYICAAILLIGEAILAVTGDPDFNPLLLGMGIFFFFFLPIYLKITSNRMYKSNKAFNETWHFDLGEKVIEVKGDSFQTKNDVSRISRFIETKKLFLLYIGNYQAYLIPKDQLEVKIQDDIRSWMDQIRQQSQTTA